ncbi:MAG TPA: histidine kinase [Streptosporangiaceae bacterium]
MWLLLKLFYRTVSQILRRFGLGLLLIPVTAVSLALFGVHVWTVLAFLLALAVAFWWPVVAAALLPVIMVAVGIAGLVLAATVTGPSGNWVRSAISVLQVNAVGPAKGNWVIKTPAGPQVVAFPVAVGGFGAMPGETISPAGHVPPPAARLAQAQAQAAYAQLNAARARAKAAAIRKQVLANRKAVKRPNIKLPPGKRIQRQPVSNGPGFSYLGKGARPDMTLWMTPRKVGVITPVPAQPSPWAGRLVPVALLLIALGLWLAPRTLAEFRQRTPGLLPYLRRRMQEIRWGILLVPTTVLGLTIFGANPVTLGLIAAAAIITLRWPRIAADLVPVLLTVFALYGFVLTARWESAPIVVLARQPQLYGFVEVSSRQLAVLAGAEASAFLAMAAWLFPRTVVKHGRLLAAPEPNLELEGRVQRLTETRDHALDNAASELRRIERDLHDGAQARLVALGMNLRAVERMLPASPEAALALVAEARETSVRALNDLRDLIRGICPPVLADRGLGHAVRALALDNPLPVVLDIDLPGRLSAPVESACYFAIAEVLANAVKHSGARQVQLRIRHTDGVLRIEVSDDGVGCADPANGTGLQGIERRLGTFDGILAVNSPPGGPTMVVMEVPCALSSPKTCSC